MKILFIISAMGQGKGGHYHSLNHISRQMGKELSSRIVTVGPNRSSIIENNPYFSKSIHFNGLNFIKFCKEIKRELTEYQPDILHFFDVHAYNAVLPFVNNKKVKYVLNLCGGPNPADFPKVDNLVLFSKENKNWFKSKKKWRNTSIHLIPNRVKRIETVKNPLIEKDQDYFNLVRIARISNFHAKSIFDSVNLFNILKKNCTHKIRLYLIGAIQDEDIYDQLINLTKTEPDILILSEDEQTQNAAKMLYLADAVIGTGRSIMEAASLKLPVLTPAANSNIPILTNQNNYDNFFGTNFSPRNTATKYDLENNLQDILKLVNNYDYYKKASSFSYQIFLDYFEVSNAYDKYYGAYSEALAKKKHQYRFSDILLKIRTLYYFYLHSSS